MFQVRRYLLIVVLLLSLAACGSETPPPANSPTAASQPATNEPTTAEGEPTELPEPVVVTEEEPTEEPSATSTASPTTTAVSMDIGQEYDGIYFDAGGLGTVRVEEVAQQSAEADAPYWGVYPAHQQFFLDDYLLDNTFHEPRLTVYPAQDYVNLNPIARDRITELQTLLEERPTDFSERDIPFLPIFNAAQVFRTQIEYIEFANGRGIRFLTHYSQDIGIVTSSDLFYTFQGLTNDGNYYVSAILPVTTASLPATAELITDYDAFIDTYDTYLQETIAELDQLSAGEFIPTLTALDNLVQSIEITRPLPIVSNQNSDGSLALTIMQPISGSQLPIGHTVQVNGVVAPGVAQPVTVALELGANTLVSTTVSSEADSGAWSAALEIPLNAIGPGRLIAQTETEVVTNTTELYLPNGTDSGPTTITLLNPLPGEQATEGITFFFAGTVTEPLDDTITIGIAINECTEFIARQNFTLSGGSWTGQVILPADVTGPACAIAYTGTYGEGGWREVARPVNIVSRDAETVARVSVPVFSTVSFTKGSNATIFGTAVNPPDSEIQVALKNLNEEIFATGTATVNTFGYWEISLPIPAD
ncbi:MAG: hypothetical protein KDE51_10645, partial [Anaerolineales bacterium]|nr:hypothetical protein [Anaerolineales bacterium]